jgi:Mce-associated membrane protein
MPTGKKMRTGTAEPAEPQDGPETTETTVDEPAAVEDETSTVDPAVEPAVQETAEAPAVETSKKNRRNFLRRRRNQPEVIAPETAEAEKPSEAQQPGDAQAPAQESGGEATPAAEDVADATEATEAAEPADAEEPQPEPVLVPHRPAGRRLKIAAAAAAVLFVAGGAFAGATAQPVIANRALVETKLDIARTAANAITTLWSYTPENMDSLADRSARYLTGDFAFQYRKFIDSIVATNKQAQVTNTTSVLGAAVESVTQSEAAAVVYTNSIATSPVSKNIPSLRYLSYRLEMKRDRSDWRITRMTTITSLDLTPQL